MSKRQLSPAWAYVHDILQQYPNTPSLTLAKKIVSENPALFTTVEAARTAIRYFRGASGSSNRKHADPKLLRPFDEALFNPFGLPDSDEVEYIPFILPDDCSRVLYLTDVHVPYHNIAALTAAIQYGIELKADSIFIGGDFLDFYSLSTLSATPANVASLMNLKWDAGSCAYSATSSLKHQSFTNWGTTKNASNGTCVSRHLSCLPSMNSESTSC